MNNTIAIDIRKAMVIAYIVLLSLLSFFALASVRTVVSQKVNAEESVMTYSKDSSTFNKGWDESW